MSDRKRRLVVFGASNILSDLFDCALANGMVPVKVVMHLPEDRDPRSVPVAERAARLAPFCTPPVIEPMSAFLARRRTRCTCSDRPRRRVPALAEELRHRFDLVFHTLVHPTAYVSPLATIGRGARSSARGSVYRSRRRTRRARFRQPGCDDRARHPHGRMSRIHPGSGRSAGCHASGAASRSASVRR